MEEINTATEKPTAILILETVRDLSEESQILILGVARGIALSASIPVAG